jgi:hypothetical protein
VAIFFAGGAFGSTASAFLALASFSLVCVVGALLTGTVLLPGACSLYCRDSLAARAYSVDGDAPALLTAEL